MVAFLYAGLDRLVLGDRLAVHAEQPSDAALGAHLVGLSRHRVRRRLCEAWARQASRAASS
jgi:hypothetical protein